MTNIHMEENENKEIRDNSFTEKRRVSKLTISWWGAAVVLAVILIVFKVDVKVKLNPSIFGEQSGGQAEQAVATVVTPASVADETILLQQAVLPAEGYTISLEWGDTGKKLVESGAIDMDKYRENYGDTAYADLLTYLTENKSDGITITSENAYFWVNTLWALGLTQSSDVLEKGIMMAEYKDKLANFASTGGWTLGAKDSMDLYSSQNIVILTPQQQSLVARVSEGIYRPCCGNSTAFPDCNHGMAILGLLELMASQGFSEEEMYKASLVFNSYWFPQTYIDLAYYFKTKENTPWKDVDARKALGAKFSSSQGYSQIKKQIGTVPGTKPAGGSCGA